MRRTANWMTEECRYLIHWCELKMIIHVLYVCVCSVTLDLISSRVFVIIIISVIFIRNFILPGIRYIEISIVSGYLIQNA